MCTIEPEIINSYSGVFDLKTEIEKYDLKNTDEAVNICNLTSIINKFNTWMKHMPNVMPFYAVKCNDHPFILQTLANLGTGFDCASKNELKQVIECGVSPDRIIFANPMKPTSHIQFAKSKNITDSTVDNEFEIYKIFKYYRSSNMILRFRSEAKKAQCPLGDKFGCQAYDDGAALMILAKSLNVNMAGVSFHVGSGCSDLPAYEKAIHTAGNLFQFGKFIGHNIEILDIGGGFPGDDDVMFADIAKIVNNSLRVHFGQIKVKIIAEPGRFFVASAYTLVCKIYSKREIRTNEGKLEKIMYYLNDGVYGTFNCILYDHNEIKAVHFMHEETETFNSLIWGPTCDALDKICDNVLLPNLKEGDLLAFPNMGAYTVPIASPFNGFYPPKTCFYLRNNYFDKNCLFSQKLFV